jgi:2-C-methyl-D-erythritol 2,4-cyclodiphosphate synthase
MRIGYGYDAHRLKTGRKCILCGVEIPCDFGPLGHSDADVPLHALMDAMLGALALGDIGKFFPDTEKKWHNASSIELLKSVYSNITEKGYTLSNADITIILESPRVGPYIEKMRHAIADAIRVDVDKISVKATTEENPEQIGDGGEIKSTAVVLLQPR